VKFPTAIISLVLLFSLIVWFRHTENMDVFLAADLPGGQRFYLFSKLLALVSLACLILQIVFMMYGRYGLSSQFKWSLKSHRTLGVFTFFLIAGHGIAFIIAASLRGTAPAYSLLLPNFHSGLYNAAVSLGLIAFYLSIFVVVLGLLSRGKPFRFGLIHRCLVWVVFLCVIVHSMAIGSESRTWPMLLFYLASIVSIAWLLFKKQRHRSIS